jgi:hypothetical protein
MNKLRSHLYPTVIGALPWSDELIGYTTALLEAKISLFEACHRRFNAGASMRAESEALGLRPLRDVFRALAPRATLGYSDGVAEGDKFEVGDVEVAAAGDLWVILPDITDDTVTISVPTEELANLIAAGLRLNAGSELTRASLLRLPIPPDAGVASVLSELSVRYATNLLEETIEREVDRIDEIVAPALGLDSTDISFIQSEMANDPFLSRIRPRYPYFTPKQRGRRTNLERPDRYLGVRSRRQ